MLPSVLESRILALTGASRVRRVQRLQSLWGGWGEILRCELAGASVVSVVVKVVRPDPTAAVGDVGVARKVRSYEVEQVFYRGFSGRCGPGSRVPAALAASDGVFVLEDLDAAGYALRHGGASIGAPEITGVLVWLAEFHATFMGDPGRGLWETGSYWHLATRPAELARMADGPLKRAAPELDARLEGARHRTLVHGDAKLANFCFGEAGVAAVDFQYTGSGVGVRDLAYLLGCLPESELQTRAGHWEDVYFAHLREALHAHERGSSLSRAVEGEWRELLPVAIADFERFLAGWGPSHRIPGGWADLVTQQVLSALPARR